MERRVVSTLLAAVGVLSTPAILRAESPKARWVSNPYHSELRTANQLDETGSATPQDTVTGVVKKEVPKLPHPARVAAFERVLNVPTSDLVVSKDRVAVVEIESGRDHSDPSAITVWLLSDRTKVRLAPLPDSSWGWGFGRVLFDNKNGTLSLWTTASPDAEAYSSTLSWHGRWVKGPHTWPPTPPVVEFAKSIPAPPEMSKPFRAFDGHQRPWIVGAEGAFVFDSGIWWRAAELPPLVNKIAAQGPDTIWVTSPYGLFRGQWMPARPLEANDPLRAAPPAPPPVAKPAALAKLADGAPLGWQVERVTLPVKGSKPLVKATAVAVAPDGAVYFTDGRIVVLRDGKAQLLDVGLYRDAMPFVAADASSWFLAKGKRYFLPRSGPAPDGYLLPDAASIAVRGTNAWMLSCRKDDPAPFAAKLMGSTWQWAPEIPHACYHSVTFGPDGSAWMVGALDNTEGMWPVGEGIIVHRTSERAEWIRYARSPLISVAVTDSGDAWAGGYDGQLAHIQGSKVMSYVLKDEPWILSLLAVKNTVYLAGESLVAKIEGETLSRVPPRNLPLGTWRSIAIDKQGALWAVGDAGIVRMTPR